MNNNEVPRGWDVFYHSESRCFMYRSRRSGTMQKTKPRPDHLYLESNPEHNRHRLYRNPHPVSYQTNSSLAKEKIQTLPEPLHQQSHNISGQHANKRPYHSNDHKGAYRPPGPSTIRRQRTAWEALHEQAECQGPSARSPNHNPTVVRPIGCPGNLDVASQAHSEAESFASVTTVAHGEARFVPAWHELRGLRRGREMARIAPMGNDDAYKLVFEMPVELLFIYTMYGYIIKLNKTSESYTKSVRTEAMPILKINKNPDPLQPDILLNVSNGTHIVYELRHYMGRRAPHKQLACYIREPAREGRNIVVLERKWDVVTKHPVTVTLTVETYTQAGRHSAVTDPRYMEIHRFEEDKKKGTSYEAVEFVPPRTSATVTGTLATGIRQISVNARVNIPLLVLILAGADMMWQ